MRNASHVSTATVLVALGPSRRLRRALNSLEVGDMALLPGGWGCGDFMARQYISFAPWIPTILKGQVPEISWR